MVVELSLFFVQQTAGHLLKYTPSIEVISCASYTLSKVSKNRTK